MRGPKVTEKLALAASLFCASCASDHRVSPWGGRAAPPLGAYVARPDLEAQLRIVDAETAELGLTRALELRGRLARGAGDLVIRGYTGADALGRPIAAVRVATPRGIVMAVGPLNASDADRTKATELVPALLPGEPLRGVLDGGSGPGGGQVEAPLAFASGTDLNGDGDPDVVLRSEPGTLEVWAIRAIGTRRHEVTLEVPPALALDVDQDGRVDLAGRVPLRDGDPIAPDFLDAATFEGDAYTNRSASARAWHAALAEALATRPKPKAREAPEQAEKREEAREEPDAARLRRALERAWHGRLAGEPKPRVLEALDREAVPAALKAAFAAHRARVAAAGGGR